MTSYPPAADHGPDLDDPGRFAVRRRVPILDQHDHPVKGDVTPELLHLIARNGNDRARLGHYALLIPGHTRDGAPESAQPPHLGFARGFQVGDFRGRPCLLADFYIEKDKLDAALSFPFRSVERWSGPAPEDNVIDHISLLRTSPQRPLGLLTYSRPPGVGRSATLVRYARDLPPLARVGAAGAVIPTPSPKFTPEIMSMISASQMDDLAEAVADKVFARLLAHFESDGDAGGPGTTAPPGLDMDEIPKIQKYMREHGIDNATQGMIRYRADRR